MQDFDVFHCFVLSKFALIFGIFGAGREVFVVAISRNFMAFMALPTVKLIGGQSLLSRKPRALCFAVTGPVTDSAVNTACATPYEAIAGRALFLIQVVGGTWGSECRLTVDVVGSVLLGDGIVLAGFAVPVACIIKMVSADPATVSLFVADVVTGDTCEEGVSLSNLSTASVALRRLSLIHI